MVTRALMVAAPRSGAGKTTVATGLMRALRRRGRAVRGAKCGPDYIDPGFHAAACGRSSVNLDGWAMPPALLAALAGGHGEGGENDDLLVVEAAMGLFDGGGAPGPGGTDGSAAALARALGLPVLLVLDISGQAQSAAAVARGFASFDPEVRVAGVVLNRAGSSRHAARARAAIEAAGIAVFGTLAREAQMALPERHLGLVQAGETAALDALLDRFADRIEAGLDLDATLAAMLPPRVASAPASGGSGSGPALAPPGQVIALARDAAFGFHYPHLLAGWRARGAEIAPFSPLADEPPCRHADAVWLPGGYPELHAGRLAGNRRFLDGLRAARGVVHGECGGHMVLGRAITDASGARHAMAGLLSHETSFAARRLSLGYRTATLLGDGACGPAGTVVAGHEFRYATEIRSASDAPFARVLDGEGACLGEQGGRAVSEAGAVVSGSFFHAIAARPAGGSES